MKSLTRLFSVISGNFLPVEAETTLRNRLWGHCFRLRNILVPVFFVANSTTPAQAQFAVCNQTFDVVNVAIAKFEETLFVSSGWWTIGPNQCANVIKDELDARYIYVFAQDVFGNSILPGTDPLCVSPERFEIRGERDCLTRGYIEARFHKVDTRSTERWTLFLTQPAQ